MTDLRSPLEEDLTSHRIRLCTLLCACDYVAL